MRRLTGAVFVSLDGVMQAPGGPEEDPSSGFKHGGWSFHFWDESLEKPFGEVIEADYDLLLGKRTYEIGAGDYVCFPAGQKAAHCLINRGTETCRFVIIGERNPNDVIVYPDLGKVKVMLTGENYRTSTTVGYWRGRGHGWQLTG